MDGLLMEVSTSRADKPRTNALTEIITEVKHTSPLSPSNIQVNSPETALEALRNQPDFQTLSTTLQWLTATNNATTSPSFSILRPSALAAQIINALVSEIIPVYWTILNEKISRDKRQKFRYKTDRSALLSCLKCLTGLNAIVLRLKALCRQAKEPSSKETSHVDECAGLIQQQDVLASVLQDDTTLGELWHNISLESDAAQRSMLRELTALIAGGKIVNAAAEADAIIRESSKVIVEPHWTGDGVKYSAWLGRNFRFWIQQKQNASDASLHALTALFSRSLRLGYPDTVCREILQLVLGNESDIASIRTLMNNLPSQDQKSLMDAAIKLLSKRFSSSQSFDDLKNWSSLETTEVGAAARYLSILLDDKDSRKAHFVSWLTSPTGAGLGDGIGIRRTVLASIATSKSEIEAVFDKSLHQIADQLYIKHTPVLQQEVHAQVLLLSASYVHRASKIKLAMTVKSAPYLNAVSNHLSSLTPRVRLLGMIVGEAISSLVEKEDKRMRFKIDELESPEALWYKSLIAIQDSTGSLDILRDPLSITPSKKIKVLPSHSKPKPKPTQTQSKIMSIEEVSDSDLPDDELVPYPKPESDPEDSDEDATLVVRNKPKPPVYIRDLLSYLRNTESYDHQYLALTTAPSLIRRKTSFGTEVTAHTTDLATFLIGLQNKFNIPNFQDYRLQGMLATILASPAQMAPWFITTFFNGDYSISQRTSILTVLSLSARELAGLADEDKSLTSVPTPTTSFPSKTLPPAMHAIYTTPSTLKTLSTSLTSTLLRPLSDHASSALTPGPEILKIRHFSSRLAVQSKRPTPTINTLHAHIDAYIHPLIARLAVHLSSPNSQYFSPHLLPPALRTLSLALHASGPNTPSLPTLTSELFTFAGTLRRVRARAISEDEECVEALLMLYLTVLDVNMAVHARRRAFVDGFGGVVGDVGGWCGGLLRGLGCMGERGRGLAAGVLMRIAELGEGGLGGR